MGKNVLGYEDVKNVNATFLFDKTEHQYFREQAFNNKALKPYFPGSLSKET